MKKDLNQIAKDTIDSVISNSTKKWLEKALPKKNEAAVELGRKGGLKGGPARAAKLTSLERSEIAKRAAQTRWKRAKE